MRWRITLQTRLKIMAWITILDTGLLSYLSTRNLAEYFGFGKLSWLYPLCLDAVAAVGMDLWLSGSRAQRPAKYLALTAVALSLAANVTDWALNQGSGAAILGAVPPLMLAALLLVWHKHGVHEKAPTAPRKPTASMAEKPGITDAELIELIQTYERAHGPLSRRAVMGKHAIGTGRAIRVLAAARNGQ